MSNIVRMAILAAAGVLAGAALAQQASPASKPKDNLEYWLGQAQSASAPAVAAPATNPFSGGSSRADALPGAIALSDGTVMAGRLYTTLQRDLEVWVESEKRWRHVPLILVLSINPVLTREEMDKEWRWKEMGADEKVFTGRERPVRTFEWKLRLVDDSTVTGTIKGQPLWIEADGKKKGPFVLEERAQGEYGKTLKDQVYIQRVVISRRAMEEAR